MVIRTDLNPPPVPLKRPLLPAASFVLYVWRGDKFDEIGLGQSQG